MTSETVKQLNALNNDFYFKTSKYFDNSRQYSWNGWDVFWSFLIKNNIEINNIMDIGCGNGRFYKYLENRIEALCHLGQEIPKNSILENKFNYIGIDNNQFLLDKISGYNFQNKNIKTIKFDLIDDFDSFEEIRGENKYDLIVLFGVMHHIPGYFYRVNLLKKLREFLKDDGIICLSFWKFLDDNKQKEKISSWDNTNVNKNDLDENDYLLSWNRGIEAYRYCHYVSDDEEQRLLVQSELKKVNEYYADGKKDNLNKYVILSK